MNYNSKSLVKGNKLEDGKQTIIPKLLVTGRKYPRKIHQQHCPNVCRLIFDKVHNRKYFVVGTNTSQLQFPKHRN
jgi:hypothetical protein